MHVLTLYMRNGRSWDVLGAGRVVRLCGDSCSVHKRRLARLYINAFSVFIAEPHLCIQSFVCFYFHVNFQSTACECVDKAFWKDMRERETFVNDNNLTIVMLIILVIIITIMM